MADQMFEASFDLEDIIREFSGPEPSDAPEPPAEPEAADEVEWAEAQEAPEPEPDEPELTPDEPELDEPELDAPEPPAAPKKAPRSGRRKPPQRRKPEPGDLYDDDYFSLAAIEEDYDFSAKAVRPARSLKLPEPPLHARSASELLREVGGKRGRMVLRLRIALVVTVVSVLLTVYHGLGLHWVRGFENVSSLGIISLLLLLAAAGACYDVFVQGIRQVLRLQFGAQALLLVTTLAAFCEACLAIQAVRMPFCSLVSVELLCALWSEERRSQALCLSAEVCREAEECVGVRRMEHAWSGRPAIVRAAGDPAEFDAMLEADDPHEGFLRIYVPLAFALTVFCAAIGALVGKVPFLWLWTALLIVALPFGTLLGYTLPYSLLAGQLAREKAALCGWYGARVLGGCKAVLLPDDVLFSGEGRKLSGVKGFNGRDSVQIMRVTAAVLDAVGCDIASLLLGPSAKPLPVEQLRVYNEGGYSAVVGADTVLVGTLTFLRRMGVHMENGAKVRQALHVAINGEFAGVVALHYAASKRLDRAMRTLSDAGAPIPVLVGGDVLATSRLLRAKTKLPLKRLRCPSLRDRVALGARSPEENAPQGAILARSAVSALAAVSHGAKALLRAVCVSGVLSVLGGLCGIVLLLIGAVTGEYTVMPCARLLAFLSIWAAASALAAASVLRR